MVCSICLSKKLSYLFSNQDNETKKKFKILICRKCLHKFTIFKDHSISKFYTKNYYGSNKKKFKSIFENFSILLRYFRIRNFLFIKNKKILDIGFGRGIELSFLQKKNSTYGIEISEDFFSKLRKLGIKTVLAKNLGEANFSKNYFDYVMMWHNLEHQKNVNNILKKTNEILKSKGKLIIEVPNSESLQAKFSKKHWIYWDTPRHLHHFSRQSMSKLLKNNNFKIINFTTFSIEYGPFGMANSIVNFFCKNKNLLYKVLLNNKIDNPDKLKYFTILFWYIIIFPFAFFLEFFSSKILKKGSVLNIVAEKNV
jgi:2-polyprenyl-3-methyl-5-hydroxy-6-metoxy-1,4-benzoquinol methylase